MMLIRRLQSLLILLLLFAASSLPVRGQLAELEQQAFNDAVAEVTDSVVQIRTIGGLDRVGKSLISQGPTTGLIVSPDGYIISSAFNFAAQPSSILVRLADGEQHSAELIARDKNRMLVLLKINAERALPVPIAVEQEEIQVGQWAIALGRTFQAKQVDISVGIVSATDRMYGRVLQTDANVSVANYGGPLVDIAGRVLGVLVPMSPQAASHENNELAGAEYYDSGIGFAVPLEHVLSHLERLRDEKELLPGKLGIGLEEGDAHVTEPKITSVWPGSPAAGASWQARDLITAVNGAKVSTQAQLRFQIMPRYAGDTIQVTLDRAGEEIETEVTLTGKLPPYRHAFLGILPQHDEGGSTKEETGEASSTGLVVRLIWPDSPAARAGLQVGDRISKLDDAIVETQADLKSMLTAGHPDKTVALTVIRGEEELALSATLSTMPEEILSPAEIASLQGTEVVIEEEEAQFKSLMVPEFAQEAVYWSPTLESDRGPGLLLWLGDGDAEQNQQLLDDWQTFCQRNEMALLIAPPKPDSPWASDDLAFLQQLVRLAGLQLKIDRSRMVIVGQAKAGQLAYALAMASRSASGGVISIDAPLPRTLTPRETSPSNRLTVLAVESEGSNFAPLIRRDLEKLRELGYPTSWLQKSKTEAGQAGLNAKTRASIERWIIGLDRL